MNKTLEHAIAAVVRLPGDEQEIIGRLILDEIAAKRGWQDRFARSENQLAELARGAREQHANRQTTELTFPPEQ